MDLNSRADDLPGKQMRLLKVWMHERLFLLSQVADSTEGSKGSKGITIGRK
jgi:hypothetical protein